MIDRTHRIVGYAVKHATSDGNIKKWVNSKAGKEEIEKVLIEAREQSLERHKRQQVSYEELTTPVAF